MSDPMTVIVSAKAVVAAIKQGAALAKKAGNQEVYAILLDAQEQTLDLREEVLSLRTEGQELRAENARLRQALEKEERLEFHHDTYWLRTAPQTLDGPFSTTPWDERRKLLRMSWSERGVYDAVERVRFHLHENNESKLVPVSFLRANRVPALEEHEEMERDRS